MPRFDPGDRVRIDIPDESDPDHQQYHGTHGEIVDIYEDNVDQFTGDERDSCVYRVTLNGSDDIVDFRWRDLRPPIE